MDYGFRKVSAATFDVKIGDVEANKKAILDVIKKIDKDTDILVFPELCLTGYSCQDMFLRKELSDKALKALLEIKKETAKTDTFLVVSLPLRHEGKLFNAAAILYMGRILAVIPKS